MSAEPLVTIRPSRAGLILMVAWIGFLCLVMVLGAAGEHDTRGLFLVFVWLPWLVPVALAFRSGLTVTGDALTSQGLFRARAWPRSEIQSFEIASTWWSPRARQIVMHTSDDEWVAFFITITSWPRRTARLERWHTALEDWRTGLGQVAT